MVSCSLHSPLFCRVILTLERRICNSSNTIRMQNSKYAVTSTGSYRQWWSRDIFPRQRHFPRQSPVSRLEMSQDVSD